MKANSDILLSENKNLSSGIAWNQLANHTISTASEIVKTYQYGYQLGLARSLGPEYATAEQIRELQVKRMIHGILGIGGALLLLIAAVGEVNRE